MSTKYLNLLEIKLPAPGITSILHRISGLIMILSLPLLVWFFGLSIQSETGFSYTQSLLQNIPGQLTLALLAWALSHHLLAGIRFLLIDVEIGVSRQSSRLNALVLNALSLVLFFIFIGIALL